MSEWQLFGDLPDATFEALKRDIARRGVLVPVELDENGAVLDGHHRIRACEELGISDYPTVVRHFDSELHKRLHVIALNTARRQMAKPKVWRHWVNEAEQLSFEVGLVGERVEPFPEGVIPIRKPTPTSSAAHATERQRYHRLRERLRPMEPVSADTDPWEIAAEILNLLAAVRRGITDAKVAEKLELAEKLCRQLAWGPEDVA